MPKAGAGEGFSSLCFYSKRYGDAQLDVAATVTASSCHSAKATVLTCLWLSVASFKYLMAAVPPSQNLVITTVRFKTHAVYAAGKQMRLAFEVTHQVLGKGDGATSGVMMFWGVQA